MKVLLLAPVGSSHTFKWAESLARRNIKICVVGIGAVYKPLLSQAQSDIIVHSLGIEAATIKKSVGNFAKLSYVKRLPLIKRLISSFEPDIVHAHFASSHGLLASLANFHPLIVSVWGTDVYDFPEISPLHQAVLRFTLSRADRILSTSVTMAKQTTKFTNKPIEVTPFGVDMDQFCPQPKPVQRGIVVGTVKSLEPKYGVDYLLRAFKLLSERNPLLALNLLVVGGGSQQKQLEALAGSLKIQDKVTFTGHVPHHEIPRWHNMIDISVFTSTSESFGVAAVEASACGKPVVASDIGGLPEVVEHGVTGFIVPPRNPAKTAAAIEQLMLDDQLRVRMGSAGRRRTKELFNWDDNVRQMVGIYDSLLPRKTGELAYHFRNID